MGECWGPAPVLTSSLKTRIPARKMAAAATVSQSNESDCIYFCVMTGRTGRNLSDLWDFTRKPPVVNFTFPRNNSSMLDLESILPNLITSAENTEFMKNVPTELWTSRTSTSSSVDEGFLDIQAVTSQGPSDPVRTRKKPLELSETLVGKQSNLSFTTKEIPLKIGNIAPTKLPPFIHGVASKENKISPTKSLSLVDTIAQKHQPVEKQSLLPPNTLKDHSISFLSQKAQNGSSLKVPGWTTIAALEMLQRPYTIMPLWTGDSVQHDNISVTTRMTVPSGLPVSQTQTGPSRRASSGDVPSMKMDATVVSTWAQITSPSNGRISLEMSPPRMTMAALDLVQRPYTMMPLWTGTALQHDNISVTTKMTVPPGLQVSQIQTHPLPRASSMDVPPGNMDARYTPMSTWAQITSLSHGKISLEMSPLRTMMATLDLVQRPNTMMTLLTGSVQQHDNISVTTKMTVPPGLQASQTQTRPSPRASSMDVPPGNMNARHTLKSTWAQITSPSHGRISLDMTLMRADHDFIDQQNIVTARKPAQITNGKKHPIPPVTLPLMQVLLPQTKPSVDSPRISLTAYTRSRCRQTKLEVTPPSITSVVPKISSCVMELCRFYQQCLCTNQELYSRYKKHRQCIQFYSWYLKNATYICEKLQGKPNRHKTTYAQESGGSPVLPELTDLPLRNINNVTFDGVFKNIESVTSFLDCLGSHFTWLQVIFTNFPALLNFVSKLKCVTGLCPKDLEDYGCACRYELEGLPIDAADSCCFQHRKCYEEASEMDCSLDPSKIIADVSCLTKNLTCESGSDCEKLLCDCDKAAIECFVNTHINSSLKGLDITFCPAPVTVTPETVFQNGDIIPDSKSQQNRSVDTFYWAAQEGELNPQQSDVMAALPSTEEMTNTFQTSTAPPDTPAVESSMGPGYVLNNLMPAAQGTPQPPNVTPTKSGFKIVEESTLRSHLAAATETESVEQVCDRFHFQRVKEDGSVKSDLPLLGEMLYCLTGRCPEDFELYGCYCGQEGIGNPKDILDSCCFSHQCCIEHLKKLGCAPDRNVRSEVVCIDRKPTCVGWSICDKLVCACDKAAAECMAAAPFNGTMRSLNRRQCQGAPLLCRNGGSQAKPERAMGTQSDSSDSEDSSSSEEQSPMREIVRAEDSGSLVPRGGRRTRSIHLGN
ncbi:uncharacterized protein LOC130274443 isoform X3 [Hyla sarda]|uniref:uncharacterized protein LOC130274443 isoform X3 n=1 Tax=Hyla sarda TaxID=327740 RepID=UPI0024C29F09|nr:uncharacterized protein LOC130274443 isoform X3 [Hyla sarda]